MAAFAHVCSLFQTKMRVPANAREQKPFSIVAVFPTVLPFALFIFYPRTVE